ncbi:MAG: restriction endonuclease subunit S, partial [Candidatus Aenigmatarchaeota archaeon]
KGIGHKEFKDTEIGRIPKEWEVVKLSEVANVRRGASPRPKGDPRYFGGSIPWIKISDLTKYKKTIYLQATDDTITKEGKKRSLYLPDGSLIISNSGTIGEPAIIATGRGGCIHDGFIYIAPLIHRVDKFFLYYFFEFKKTKLQARAQKGTQENLNTSIWKSIRLPCPHLPEQQKIAEILSTVDKKLELERKRKEKLERIKKGLMNDLLTGKKRVKIK